MIPKQIEDLRWREFEPFLEAASGDDDAATRRAVAEGYIPPHWTGYTHCPRCGTMPAPPELDGQRLMRCAWCNSKGGGLLDRIAAFNSEQEGRYRQLVRIANGEKSILTKESLRALVLAAEVSR